MDAAAIVWTVRHLCCSLLDWQATVPPVPPALASGAGKELRFLRAAAHAHVWHYIVSLPLAMSDSCLGGAVGKLDYAGLGAPAQALVGTPSVLGVGSSLPHSLTWVSGIWGDRKDASRSVPWRPVVSGSYTSCHSLGPLGPQLGAPPSPVPPNRHGSVPVAGSPGPWGALAGGSARLWGTA